ncbi:MAG: NAD(P)-dependent oxidoreductase [Phycicoccus sp.]
MPRSVVVAATGGIGRHLLTQALAAGHEVTAVVRDPARLSADPSRVVTCDLTEPVPAVLESAVDGADVVLSALGARTKAEAGIASRGTRAVVHAMQATGVGRIVAVSAASVGTVASPGRPRPPRHNPGDGFVMRHLIAPTAKALFRRHYLDLAIMEDVLRDSALDWTVSRPPRLLDHRLRRTYRTAVDVNVRGGLFISRADVARHMLDMANDPATVHHTVSAAY